MHAFVKALAVVLVVPVICTALALTSRSELDARWQASLRRPFLLRRQMPDERVIARYSLAALCSDARNAASIRPCRPYNLFSSMATAAGVTGGLGVGFLAAIVGAGAACRSRRDRLLRLFRPALHSAVSGLVVLVVVHGGLGIAGVFLLGDVIQRWPITMVLVLAGATLAAALSMIHLALFVTRRTSQSLVGRAVSPWMHPRFREWVREIAMAVRAQPPDHVVVGLRPGVYVTDSPVECLDGRLTGRTLYLPLSLGRILSIEECRGLVAHELAHVAAGQVEESRLLVPLHAGARRSIRVLSERAAGIRGLTALPALSVLSLFMDAFEPGIAAFHHDRELAADRASADLVGPATLASALVKTHAFTPAWDAVAMAMDRAVLDGSQYVNASVLFAQVASASAGPERLAGVGALSATHPTDVHPPLAARLKALGVAPGDVSLAALVTQPSQPAVSLLDAVEAIERDLSEVEHRMTATSWSRSVDAETGALAGPRG